MDANLESSRESAWCARLFFALIWVGLPNLQLADGIHKQDTIDLILAWFSFLNWTSTGPRGSLPYRRLIRWHDLKRTEVVSSEGLGRMRICLAASGRSSRRMSFSPGWQILEQFPLLDRLANVYGAIGFYLDNKIDIDAYLAKTEREFESAGIPIEQANPVLWERFNVPAPTLIQI